MGILNRNSVLAITKESTEGTPVEPSSASDFLPLRAGFSMEPNTELLMNDELRASLDEAPPVIGAENPRASFNSYLRHSGVEGQAPMLDRVFECAFGVKTAYSGSERSTTSSSTTALIKAASGGADFPRGVACLVKDPVNGYSIRPILSRSTNDLTPAFSLPGAPASGVKLGKPVNYGPSNATFSTLAAFLYQGNGGAVEVGAGLKVSSLGINMGAKKFLEIALQFEGTGFFFDPIFITSSTCKIDFHDGSTDYHVSVSAKVYKDPNDLAEAIQTAMNSAGASDTYTVTYNNVGTKAGKFTIATSGSTLTIKWNTGTNTANTIATKIGFSAAADSSSATSYDSATALSFAAGYTPSYDSTDPIVAKDHEVFMGTQSNPALSGVQAIDISLGNQLESDNDLTTVTGVASRVVNGRKIMVKGSLKMKQADAQLYTNYREGTNTPFAYNFGIKSGGQWKPGYCGSLYLPSMRISKWSSSEKSGYVTIDFEGSAFADTSGNGAFYLTFL